MVFRLLHLLVKQGMQTFDLDILNVLTWLIYPYREISMRPSMRSSCRVFTLEICVEYAVVVNK